MREIFRLQEVGMIELCVSQHTLAELGVRRDGAYERASSLHVLPYFPIGAWSDLVGTWNNLAGTWSDIGTNQAIQEELKSLANAGTNIRDRGTYIDALHACVKYFVTSDRQLASPGPAKRIGDRFGLKVVTPSELADELRGPGV
jgi:hypothetical protein